MSNSSRHNKFKPIHPSLRGAQRRGNPIWIVSTARHNKGLTRLKDINPAQHSFFAPIDFIEESVRCEKNTANELIDRGLWKTTTGAWTNPATHFIKSLIYKE